MTRISELTEREQEIIGLLSRAFEGATLDARVVDIHKQDGRTVSTLRFTLDDEASTDLEREHIEQSSESAEDMAAKLSDDLRAQL